VDGRQRLAYRLHDQRSTPDLGEPQRKYSPVALGHHLFSPASVALRDEWRYGFTTIDLWRGFFRLAGGLVLHDTAGGRNELRALVDASLADLVDELEPTAATTSGFPVPTSGLGTTALSGAMVMQRVRSDDGALAGTVTIGKPPVGMSILAGLAFHLDLDHLERLERFTEAGRHPAAILFADLEGSSALSRTMSTAGDFALGGRRVRAADQCLVDAGGLVGRHVGDGVVAFFPAVTSGSESTAARSCIEAARSMNASVSDVARRSDLEATDLVLRFGLHWGSTVYIGRITTTARSEVTALGDQVNETARIEACATGGGTLASKELVGNQPPVASSAFCARLGNAAAATRPRVTTPETPNACDTVGSARFPRPPLFR
jgi:class 3 adenylate cyclase